jgi:hypothetical protein
MASEMSLTAVFGGDTRPLEQSLKRAGASVSDFAGKATKNGFGDLLAPIAKVAAAVGSVGAIMKGVKGSLDLGAELQDASNRTGIAVEAIMGYRKAFREGGVDVESFGTVIARMQRSLAGMGRGGGAAQKVFKGLGLDSKELASLQPEQAFQRIGLAINALPNATERAAAAMAIFGRSGAELLSVFASPAFRDAGNISPTARLLGENAAIFKQAHDALAAVGSKLTGFFVGIASNVVPQLHDVIEEFRKLDFSYAGQQLGIVVGTFVSDWSRGISQVTEITVRFLQLAFSPTFLTPLSVELTRIATSFGFGIRKAVSGAKGSGDSSWFGISDNMATAFISTFIEKGTNTTDVFRDLYRKNLQLAREGFYGSDLNQQQRESDALIGQSAEDPLKELASAMKKIVDEVGIFTPSSTLAEANAKGREEAKKEEQKNLTQSAFDPTDLGSGNSGIFADSLARIGGGGMFSAGGDELLSETRKQTAILTQVARNTSSQMGQVAATFSRN